METLWLMRHLAECRRARQSLPAHVRRSVEDRGLQPGSCHGLVTAFAHLLRTPLCLAPPCFAGRSRHEALLVFALAALEQNRANHARYALVDLAAPVLPTRRELDGACTLLALLGGTTGAAIRDYGPGRRGRCSNGNGGVAMARTASETSARASSSPARRFDFKAPHS